MELKYYHKVYYTFCNPIMKQKKITLKVTFNTNCGGATGDAVGDGDSGRGGQWKTHRG